jgi:Pathogenicity locus
VDALIFGQALGGAHVRERVTSPSLQTWSFIYLLGSATSDESCSVRECIMTAPQSTPSVRQLQTLAHRLLKDVRTGSSGASQRAARRFRRLRSFEGLSVEDILGLGTRVRLKHALAVIAEEHGFSSWTAMKRVHDAGAVETSADANEVYTPALGFFLNRWFATYDQARWSLESSGGYLFPHREQFFICEREAVRELGLDPDDPDWERVGFDWARPADTAAFARLRRRWHKARQRRRAEGDGSGGKASDAKTRGRRSGTVTSEKQLQVIPGVGPSIARDLVDIGIGDLGDLRDGDPEELFERLCLLRGEKIDRCVLYVFRCAVYYASNDVHDPERLKWWWWKDGSASR